MSTASERKPQLLNELGVYIVDMDNFAEAGIIAVVKCRALKYSLASILGLAGIAFFSTTIHASDFDPIFGFYRPELFANADSSGLLSELPRTEFLDGRLPGSTALGRMGTAPVGNFPTALV